MRLWLRQRCARALDFDTEVEVTAPTEWLEWIDDPALVSSVLWPTPPLFPLAGPTYRGRSHPHERGYANDSARNLSYRAACQRLAERLRAELAGARCLVWAPLRGALPIWRAIFSFAPHLEATVHHPVTSSFVIYPPGFGIRNRKGRPGGGRTAHRLEIVRAQPFLDGFDVLVYVDEIVSGGSMKGHLRDLLELEIDRTLAVIAVGLADRFGDRSVGNRRQIDALVASGRLRSFLWEGCDTLITEDQRYLLGVHYCDYSLGPHAVPMVDEDSREFPEKLAFEREAFAALCPADRWQTQSTSRVASRSASS